MKLYVLNIRIVIPETIVPGQRDASSSRTAGIQQVSGSVQNDRWLVLRIPLKLMFSGSLDEQHGSQETENQGRWQDC